MKNICKKIIIMFVMVLGIVGVGTISNVYVANAATAGQQLTNPEEGWQRYDDESNEFIYSEMNHRKNTEQIKYTYNKTDVYGNKNSTISFAFYGTEIRLIGVEYAHASDNVKIVIDGKEEFFDCTKFDKTKDPKWQIIQYEEKNLEKGIHQVVITNIGDNGSYYFDAIDIDKDGYLLSPSLEIDKPSLTIKEDNTKDLTATTTPAGAQVNWSSSDESIATVDQTGKVTGIKEGNCIITATIKGTDIKDTCEVTVTKKDVSVETDPKQEYIINNAYAKGDNTNNASGSVSIIFNGTTETKLSVVKTADVKEVWVGDNFTYTIVVTNTGSKTAKNVVISDDAPNHISFKTDEITTTKGTVDSGSTSKKLIVNVGDILPGDTVTIKIPVTVVE